MWGILEGCTNMAWPSRRTLSEKLSEKHFLTLAWNSNFFGANWSTMEVPFIDFIQNMFQAPSKESAEIPMNI